MTAYEARPIKRVRATEEQMAERYAVVADLASAHGPCSVRHIYYRAVVVGLWNIAKTKDGYSKVQRALLELRRSGQVPYGLIVDSTRWMRKSRSYDGLEDALNATARLYRRNLWSTSPYRVEVWVESDSIGGTVFPVTDRWDVPLMACRGQASESFAWSASEQWKGDPARRPVVLYIGDHDPAGLEIEQALMEKLGRFTADVFPSIDWLRVGVTWDQVVAFDLPGTTPKKPYGYRYAVEAEALDPNELRRLLDEAIAQYVDLNQLERLKDIEFEERQLVRSIAKQWGRKP